MNEQHTIPGPAGGLEALLTDFGEADFGEAGSAEAGSTEPGTGRAIAVLCHPHPLYGGSLHDQVLAILADALAAHGVPSLRFNFRGVGASQGSHDHGNGEQDDLLAVLDWVRATWPDLPILLGGYSFGASIASQVLDRAEVARVLLIAPPLGTLPGTAPDGSASVDVIVGTSDPYTHFEILESWHAARITRIEGADHFFSAHREALISTLDELLSESTH